MRLGGLAITLVLVGVAFAAPAGATIGTIQPGDAMSSSIGGCTLNFVFDGVGALAGNVYMGTAAHCVGWVGEPIDSAPYADFGTVAIVGDAGLSSTDWAFILVKPEFEHLVKPAVKGHPSYPTGIATIADTFPGDALQFSGYGTGFGTTTPTQEKRVGVLTLHEPHRVQLIGPVIFGDSGGPIVHVESGKAISLQSRLCVAWPCTEVGPAFDDVLRQAAARGFTVELRTV